MCYNTYMVDLIRNKKARFHYEIMETLEAGIELLGFEVKSLKRGAGSLEGAYVSVRTGEALLVGMHITPYQQGNTPKEYDPRRSRRLLLFKKEIRRLVGILGKKGLTIVPISVYIKGRAIKVAVAIARGKAKYDKRETIKRREAEREMSRAAEI